MKFCAKRFRLRNGFSSKFSKMNLGGPHAPNDREKQGSKREKVIAWMATAIVSKTIFWNKEALRSKSVGKSEKNQKFIKKWSLWQVEKKTGIQIVFYFGTTTYFFENFKYRAKQNRLRIHFLKRGQIVSSACPPLISKSILGSRDGHRISLRCPHLTRIVGGGVRFLSILEDFSNAQFLGADWRPKWISFWNRFA